MVDAGSRQDLGHLPHVAELVGEIADGSAIAKVACSRQPALDVPDE
jgi:hypothetical protein